MKKLLLITAGFTSLFAAIAGIFLPLLPTTPFLLLSAACFLKSSPSLYNWLTRHRIFGNYIKGYQQHRAVSGKAKITSLLLLWLCIGFSIFFVSVPLWVKILLSVIAVCVTVHILRLKTLTKEMLYSMENE